MASKTRIVIVGGGASGTSKILEIVPLRLMTISGMSAALAFSQHPDKFDVTLYERSAVVGGMATSAMIDESRYGASYINDGVQGASPVFHNTFAVFDRLGFKSSRVDMQVSFGRDAEKEFWSNVFPSRVIDRYRRHFGLTANKPARFS